MLGARLPNVVDNKSRYPNSNGRTELRSLRMRKCAKRKICIIKAKSILGDARRPVARQRQITMKISVHNSNSHSRNYNEKGEQTVRYERTTHIKNLENSKRETHASCAKTQLECNDGEMSITNFQVKINSKKKEGNQRENSKHSRTLVCNAPKRADWVHKHARDLLNL